jgi:trans-AT polyketide synthase/acyltransferase/oxidoreductase domain-containing protein
MVIQHQLANGEPYGMNLLCNLDHPEVEMDTVELYLKHHVRRIEAASFLYMTPALVWYRVSGLEKAKNGSIQIKNLIMAKVSRPEVAEMFMSPPPARLVATLLSEGKITAEQAELAPHVPMSYDICVEADSGGHTTQGVSTVLLPSIQSLRSLVMSRHHYEQNMRVGLAGGIGTPQAIAAAFIMGADFVLTGSINQCTVEAGTSDSVKNLLQDINVQDTGYAPAGDMFEIGGRIQVLKKGVFFPARANKLHALYTQYNSLEEIPADIKKQIEEKYFKRSFESVWEDIKQRFEFKGRRKEFQQTEMNPKRKMAWTLRWYFLHSTLIALNGDETQRVDYQVHTGPALGAFNQWVKGTELESWKNRHVASIGTKLMEEAAILLSQQLGSWIQTSKFTPST